jgi:tRNA pseudouridine38-40 synthase
MTTSRRPTSSNERMDEPGQRELAGLVRLRLDLGYDGSEFHGWARQPGLRTVQQDLEEALWRSLSLPEPPALTVAGRTDAGVHARGQVAHVDVPAHAWEQAADSAARRLARLLPPDVRVWSIRPAPAGFDARFSALWRRYSYRVCDDPERADPLRRRDTLWYRHRVDLDLMNEAARACLGEHDFAAFCRRREGATTIRAVLRLDWAPAEPGVAVATVAADAFCHNMVRALTGALLSVGDGSKPVSWLADVLAARRRDPAVRVAAPHPLCLEEVGYPGPAGLAARAQLTRQTREPSEQDRDAPDSRHRDQ